MKTAQHRPAVKRRRFRHDDLVAVDLFAGFGGLTEGVRRAGFTTIMAANHNRYKVEVHEANHPYAEHWIADLVDPTSADYHSARDLPAADLLVAGVSCVNHSQANSKRAYEQQADLFSLEDPDYEAAVTRSERDRATANCVLHYADQHRPRMILIECTTELTSWGKAIPGKRKVGDGSTYRWWLNQFDKLGYHHRVMYLNSQFFDVPQSRDRLYIAFWQSYIPAPDLDHCPLAYCAHCDATTEAVWTWKTGVPPTGSVRHDKQYNYRCSRCRREVMPAFAPSINTLNLTDLGTRIGDRERPLAAATMARAERCRRRFADFPAILMPIARQETKVVSGAIMPAKAARGSDRHFGQPLATQTSQQEAGLLTTAAIMQTANSFEHPGSECRTRDVSQPLWTQPATASVAMLSPGIALAVDNFQGAPRGADEPIATQGGSETMALITAGVVPNRTNATNSGPDEPMRTVVGGAGSGGMALVSAGILPYRKNTTPTTHAEPMPTITSEQTPALLTAGWFTSNGSAGTETAPHPVLDPFGTLTSRDTTTLLAAEWREALDAITLEDCYFRMLRSHEIGRSCGFDVNFGDYRGTFIVWGSARDQIDGYGNAVSPQVGEWIGGRLRDALHGIGAAA